MKEKLPPTGNDRFGIHLFNVPTSLARDQKYFVSLSQKQFESRTAADGMQLACRQPTSAKLVWDIFALSCSNKGITETKEEIDP